MLASSATPARNRRSGAVPGTPDRTGWIALTAVGFAVALGVFLRFFRLDWQSLWVDEIHTIGPALHATSLADAFWNYINLAPTPPLYYLFMMAWTSVAGFSEFALRLPSAVIGVAAIAVFWFGLRRVLGRNVAAVATILMALSWPAIFYSQEVRAYSAVLLFTTWAAVSWMAILRDFAGSRRADWAQLTVASLLASMTHPFGFIIAGFLFLYLFLLSLAARRFVVRTMALGAFPAAAYSAWLAVNIPGIQWVLGENILFDRLGPWFFVHIGAFLFHHPIPAVLTAIVPLALGAAGYGGRLRGALSSRAWHDPAVYLPFILAAPFAFVFLVAQFQPFVYSRYLIVFLPFIYTFFAVVLLELNRTLEIAMDALRCPPGDADVTKLSGGERRRVALCRLLLQRPAVPVLLMFALATSALYWVLRDYYEVDKPQNRELAQYVLSVAGEGDVILTGCNPDPPFECTLGAGRRTDSDWSKYLYYLNYESLPQVSIVPEVFNDGAELERLLEGYRTAGTGRAILMGSRGGNSYVLAAVPQLEARGLSCELRSFHRAVAAVCRLS